MSQFPWITVLTLIPLVGALIVAGLESAQAGLARRLALVFSLAALGLAGFLCWNYPAASGALHFEETYPWIPRLAVEYHVGADGLSLLMILLSAIVVPMALLASSRIEDRVPLYSALVLFLQAGLFGTFTALNFFHWFLFWELSLVPAFFLVRLWGGPARAGAATQFFVYTMAGSIALLLAFLAIGLSTGRFDFVELAQMGRDGTLARELAARLGWPQLTAKILALVIFSGAFLGFAVKVPLIPFHTWLPPAYAEAPTGTAMLLTGLMSKMGVYGFLRILAPMFGREMSLVLTPLLWMSVATILFSACAAIAQRDLKRVLAYSSINHLGYCLLGIFAVLRSGAENEKAAALNGVFLQMFNHGLTAATLFWFVGMIEGRTGSRGLKDFGGLRRVAPVLCGLMGIAVFSSLGLPGLNGFVGEFLIFKGAFHLVPWATCLAAAGLLLTAVFILSILQHVFSGPLPGRWSAFRDLTSSERWAVAPAIALMFVLGVYPQVLLALVNGTAVKLVSDLIF